MPRSSPFPYLFLSQLHRLPSSLEGALVGFRVAILSQQLSPSRSGIPCSQPPCSSSGKHVPIEWLLRMSFREAGICRSAFPVTTQLQALPQICVWLGRSLHSSISSATIFFLCQTSWHALIPNRVASSFSLSQPTWLLLTHQTSWWTRPPSLSACPYFKR